MSLGKKGPYLHRQYPRESKPRRRLVLMIGIALLAGVLAYYKYIDMTLSKANKKLAENDWDRAEAYFGKVASLPFSGAKGQDGLGALDLLRGDLESAKVHFKRVLERKPSDWSGDPAVILRVFLDHGAYESGRIYADFIKNWKTAEKLGDQALDLAALFLGARDLVEARAFLDRVTPSARADERFGKLETLLADYERDGRIPVMLDRNGEALLFFHTDSSEYRFENERLFSGWADGGADALFSGVEPADRLNRLKTTLDLRLQKAAFQAMKGYRGTMIMLDPSSGDLLAAFATEGLHPFQSAFEPGSVIKLLTFGFFLEEGGDLAPYAPAKYTAGRKFGGRVLRDWTVQGQLNSVDEGMAVSCNIMFAQMGVDLGWPKLGQGLKTLFDGSVDPGMVGAATSGKLLREPETVWEVGRASVGLDFLQTTVYGLIQIPAAVANRGNLMKPRLYSEFLTVEDRVYKQRAAESPRRLFSETGAAKLAQSMKAALYFERGTARRARVDFLEAGMKTGTAGERPFDSIMVGILPLSDPKLVFAFYLDKGGKCEVNGARVAKHLQEQIKALAPAYLE